MPESRTFQAFFSYAHHDAATDPGLVEALTVELEKRVTAHLVNDRFVVWRDTKGLRTGDLWNPAIEREISASDVLIVLLTPRWLTSDYCRKEYAIFQEIEAAAGDVQLVAPISVRPLDRQREQFKPEQGEVYDSLRGRQYFQLLAPRFLQLRANQRSIQIEKIADDIEAIILRLLDFRSSGDRSATPRDAVISPLPGRARTPTHAETSKRSEPDPRAQNYERVDMVSSDPEVVIDLPREGHERGVYVQVDFIERLYVEGQKARIEFGVQRAFVTVDNDGPGSLSRSDFLRTATTRRNASFVNLHDAPGAVSVCMDPDPGRTSLAELALPPTPRENYLCQIASATADIKSACMRAELRVSLDIEGLFLADDVGSKISSSKKKQIEAIVAVAATKNHHQIDNGVIRRKLPVLDRER